MRAAVRNACIEAFFGVVIFLALVHSVVGAAAGIEPPVLRVSLESEPLTLDWSAVRTGTDRFILSFLMRGLFKYDSSNQPACDLCKSYSVSADGKAYRFELNPAEVWSDGVKLEAKHFSDSFKRLLNPVNRFKASGDFRAIESVRADGKYGLEIALREPSAGFPHLLTTIGAFPIRKELIRDKDRGETHATAAVLGPYQLAAWEHGKRVVIEGNARFTGTRPVYRVDFVLGRHGDALAKFRAGKLDILSSPTQDDLLKAPRHRLQVNPYWATRNLVLNVRARPLSDPSFRRALLYAMDRDSLPAFSRNGERRVTGLIPPGLPGYRDLPLVTADPARAKAERAAVQGLADSVSLKLLLRDLDGDRRVAEWLATQLEKIQVRLEPTALAGAAYYNALESGAFDMALTVWSFDTANPWELLESFKTGSEQNRGGFTHVGFDARLGQLMREQQQPTERAAALDQLTQILEVKDIAAIPLGYPTQPFMLGTRVLNFATTPFGDPDLVKILLKP